MTFKPTQSAALAIALLGLAAPAFAQEGLCGGTGSKGQWIGGDEASSDIATAENYLEQMALVLGGNEYVALFSLSQATDVRIEAAGRGAGDPIIDLLDNSGTAIISDDDSGGDAASRAETYLEAGTYCMALRSYDGGPMTAFVRIGRTEQAPLTDGISTGSGEGDAASGSCETAVPMGTIGDTVASSADETPYWSFTLDTPMSVSITAENETADPVLTLYDANSTYISENDDFDGLNARLDVTETLAPGTYCVGIAALNDTTLPITVSLTQYDPEVALLGLYARGEAAPPLDGSIAFTNLGTLASRLREDVQATGAVTWYTVDIADSSLVLVEAIAAGNSDPWLVVYDDLGRKIGENDDYAGALDSMVIGRVQGGTYIIGVRQAGENQGFVRLLIERYIRAQ
ncbi:DVUA0089 family protein [Yoonia sp.]|uniref:DVUA0089 family protein n=1 Tax=Yoonia sp. TaxID=2212373 RepID=UPI0025F160C5|nr:DVUA0089 family protein [Yoonia sp.]